MPGSRAVLARVRASVGVRLSTYIPHRNRGGNAGGHAGPNYSKGEVLTHPTDVAKANAAAIIDAASDQRAQGIGRMSWTKFISPALALRWAPFGIAAAVWLSVACTSQDDVPRLEQRAHELNQTIMCPVCPGESIDQSQNGLAVQMRAIVIEKLAEGWSEESIKDFFVERYGPSVLLEPSRRGFTVLVWLIPPFGAVGAAIGLYFVLRTMRRPTPAVTATPSTSQLTEDERARYFEQIEAAIGETNSEEQRSRADG